MKNKSLLLGLLLLGAASFSSKADSFYLNLNQPGVQLGVNTGDSYPAPGYWYFEGHRFQGPPPAPRHPHDKKAWKRYKKMRKEYEKFLKQHRKKHHKKSSMPRPGHPGHHHKPGKPGKH